MRRALVLAVCLTAATLASSVGSAAGVDHTCNGFAATIVGTSGPDRIVGTPLRDVIVALEGKDIIFGGGGNDIICGGPGGDLIRGQAGRDQLFGNGGNDRLLGNIGRDLLDGGRGLDRIWGGGGPDTINGGRAFDIVRGGNGNDTCQIGRDDAFEECEGGNILGTNGFGDAVGQNAVALAVPAEFAAHTATADGQAERYYAYNVVIYGQSAESVHSVRFFDANGQTIEFIVGSGELYSGQFLLGGDADHFEVLTDGWWDITYMDDTAISKLGLEVEGDGSAVYYLDPPAGPGLSADLFVGAGNDGRLVVKTFTPGSFADVKTNEPLTGAEITRGGTVTQGTYLISVRVDQGFWGLFIGE